MRTNRLLIAFIAICSFYVSTSQSEIQRVRIDFENPEGYTRHLLLGFVSDNSATDDFDYGYDAPNADNFPDDLNWMIGDERYVIQGVGAFQSNKYYPLGMFLSNSGDVSISLNALENFENEIEVYIYDLELNSYTDLGELDLTINMESGDYINRFFVTFSTIVHPEISSNYSLSVAEKAQDKISIKHSISTKELKIDGLSLSENSKVTIYSIDGKLLRKQLVNATESTMSTLSMSTGIYVVRLENSTLDYTTKVCITN